MLVIMPRLCDVVGTVAIMELALEKDVALESNLHPSCRFSKLNLEFCPLVFKVLGFQVLVWWWDKFVK